MPAGSVQSLLQALGDVVYELSPDGVYLRRVGDEAAVQPARAEFVGRSVKDVLPEDVAERFLAAVTEVIADGIPRAVEYPLRGAGGPRHFETRLARGPAGSVFAIVRDVQESWLAAERLRESEARFRLMADAAPVMLWKAGTDSECDFFNARWLEFTGRPLSREVGVGWAEGIHAEDFSRCMDSYLEAFLERREFRFEYRLRRADGNYRWILDQGAPRFSPSGAFEGYVGSCIDITDLREAGDRIQRLYVTLEERLEEREALLREIHHRVKNNLQLISSLLGLHARKLDGPARVLMEEGQARIRSIALVHEKLYDSKNLADVDLTEYAQDLVRMVLQASGARPGIDVSVGGDEVRLAVDQASPCGLVINELLTNALKHAFPDDRPGRVHIGVAHEASGRVAVTVRDDGVGLPSGLDLERPRSLGLDVVMTLADQLDAELVVARGPGATFRLSFPTRGDAE